MAFRLRTGEELDRIAMAGAAVDASLRAAADAATPGRTTLDLDGVVRRELERCNARPAMFGVGGESGSGPFPGACAVSVNSEATHAPPSDRRLKPGDLVTVDVAAEVGGWHADAAVSIALRGGPSEPDPTRERLLESARMVTDAALSLLGPGVRWSAAAGAARDAAAQEGVRILVGFGGHGIGRRLHEEPATRFDCRLDDPSDFTMAPGAVFTIEPIVTPGAGQAVLGSDGWTVQTADEALAACEEVTVAVLDGGARVLAGRPGAGSDRDS